MYEIEERVLKAAPHITHDDVMPLSEAAELLGMKIPSLDKYLCRGRLTTVIDRNAKIGYGRFRRMVLRQEVAELRVEVAAERAKKADKKKAKAEKGE